MTETLPVHPDVLEMKIWSIINGFDWWNYSLHDVTEATSTEWVDNLTSEIMECLQK